MATELDDVYQMLFVLLTQYEIGYEEKKIGESYIFTVEKFGVKIIYLDGKVFDDKEIEDWHVAYVFPDFDIQESRRKIVWSLIRGGYFHYLHHNYKNTFNRILHDQGWDKELAARRDYFYKDKPKYNYLRELNEEGKGLSPNSIMAIDPGYFDWLIK